jgi:hypothetical protein
MKIFVSTLLLVVAFLCLAAKSQQRNAWDAIVPLHSTRADVNRLLGKPAGDCQCVYRTPTETVSVDYAAAPCKGPINGWNVPPETVLQFRVTPASPKTFASLGLDESFYVKTQEEDTPTLYFTDVARGIQYAVQDNHVATVSRRPLPADNNLRCAGFPPYDGGITDYHPYDSFPAESLDQLHAHLDVFAHEVSTRPAFIAYVVGYAGKISKRGEAKRIAESARAYLVNKNGVRADKVFAVDGGFRENVEVELYLVPKGTAAPAPKPTLTPCEVTPIDGVMAQALNNILVSQGKDQVKTFDLRGVDAAGVEAASRYWHPKVWDQL